MSKIIKITKDEFHKKHGCVNDNSLLCGYTLQRDASIIISLLVHQKAKKILEIGTAVGQMTANLTEWSPEDATVYTIGTINDMSVSVSENQKAEVPSRDSFGKFSNHFGKAHKVCFITADSMTYDFKRLGLLDFVYVDGAHDLKHVISDSMKAYQALSDGGCLVWHDFDSKVKWIDVSRAIEQLPFETVYHVEGTEVAFLHKEPIKGSSIIWDGPFFSMFSFALINHAWCSKLLERGNDISIRNQRDSYGKDMSQRTEDCSLRALVNKAPLHSTHVHIRHFFPPDFSTQPESGYLIVVEAWDYGTILLGWKTALLEKRIDELWVSSHFSKSCFTNDGVPSDLIHVIPHGMDSSIFRPDIMPYSLMTNKKFKFLFVGGAVYRKGIDLLLEAFINEFTDKDDVCLVIKDLDMEYYRDRSAKKMIEKISQYPNVPTIEYMNSCLSEKELASLYTACDCYVHPFRAEGFALPIIEAMGCGLPVVVPDYGPVLDYCSAENAYFIPSSVEVFPNKLFEILKTVNCPQFANVDVKALRNVLRFVYEHPKEAKAKGINGSKHVHKNYSWDHIAFLTEERIKTLLKRPPRLKHKLKQPKCL